MMPRPLHRRIFRFFFRFLAGFFAFLLCYGMATVFLTWIPANSDFEEPEEGVLIAVHSNGVHTDIVMPVKNELYDWSAHLSCTDTRAADSSFGYVSVGWGDKGFYIETPTWADLKTSTALKAAFWLSRSAMHVTWRRGLPAEGESCEQIRITPEQYKALCAYVQQTFALDVQGRVQFIQAPTYTPYDAFYEAHGRYNLFKTCNVWAGNALRYAGVKMSLWTPFDKCVFYHLPAN